MIANIVCGETSTKTNLDLYKAAEKFFVVTGEVEIEGVLSFHCWLLNDKMECANFTPATDVDLKPSQKKEIITENNLKLKVKVPKHERLVYFQYRIFPVTESVELYGENLPDILYWKVNLSDGNSYKDLDFKKEVTFQKKLKAGKYILSFFGEWKGL